MAKYAGYLVAKGVVLDAVLTACQSHNLVHYKPPLSEAEVERTVRSIYSTDTRKKSK
jgi:hypothetical protein